MGSKGTNTTTTSTSANPAALSAYYNLLPQIQNVASTPYQAYQGQLVAPVNEQQQTGIAGINTNAYAATPYLTQAGGLLTSAAQPLTTQQIQQYYSPYQQDVVNATEAQFANTNAQQQQQVLGNAAAQGALGGDRTAVAQAVLAGQQQAQQAPVIAGLENQGYTQALQTAGQQFQQNPEAVAYGLGSTGTALENAALTGANAQVGAGTLEQQTQQAADTAAYQQYMQAMQYPFATTGWEAGLETGVGSAMGGTGTTTTPAPNQTAQYAGLGLTALGLFAKRGGRIQGLASGGSPFGGGMPYSSEGFPSWVPTAAGFTPLNVQAPKPMGQQTGGQNQMPNAATIGAASQGGQNILGKVLPGSESYGGGNMFSGDAFGGSASSPLSGLSADDYGGDLVTVLENRGGRVERKYGGLALPKSNRIQLRRGGVPVRAGLGLASFVNRGFDEGGAATDDDTQVNFPSERFITPSVPSSQYDDYLNNRFKFQAYGLGTPYADDPTTEAARSNEDQALPPEITQGRSVPAAGLGTSSALAFTPSETTAPPVASQAPPPSAADMIAARGPRGITTGFNLISPDAKSALLSAGLGMMASRSPFLGVAIGEGGQQGLATYSGLKKQEQDTDLAVARLNQQAKAEQDRIAQETKQLAETSRHNKAVETYQQSFKQFEETKPQTMFDQNTGTVRAYGRDQMGVWRWLDSGQPMVGAGVPTSLNQPTASPSNASSSTQPSPAPTVTPAAFTGADGFRVQNARAVASGQAYNYSNNAPYIEAGMDLPEPTVVAGRSVPTLKTDAEYFLQTGKAPPVSRGNSPVAMMQNAYSNAVKNYGTALAASRGLTPEQTADMWRSAPGMLRFVMGADGRATVSLGTAIRHLDLLQQLGTAWGANDIQAVNRVRSLISREFGGDAATNLTTASQIVGPEIIKAIGVAGGGGEAERRAASAWANPISSPEQLSGAIRTTQGLLAGQLEGKRRQAAAAGVDEGRFKNLIGDRPYEILTNINHAGTSGAAGPTLPAGVPTGSVHGTSRTQGPGWQTPDGRFIPDRP